VRTRRNSRGIIRHGWRRNKSAGLLIENGVPYETRKLDDKNHFAPLLQNAGGMTDVLHRLLSSNGNADAH
jgi:hypothetical protein